MVQEEDFIRMEYTLDLAQAGIAYALQWLASAQVDYGESTWSEFQALVINKAVELAFRRYLTERRIPNETATNSSFAFRGDYSLALGGWHCVFQCTLLDQPGIISNVESCPGDLLKADALVLSDQVVAWLPGEKDLYVFGFVIGTMIEQPEMKEGEAVNGQPALWLDILPLTWGKRTQAPLGRVSLKVEDGPPQCISIGGRAANLLVLSERIDLQPGRYVTSQYEYNSLSYIYSQRLPTNRIRIACSAMHHTHEIHPTAWKNVWVGGRQIILGGYMSCPEYSRRSRRLAPAGYGRHPKQVQDKYRVLTIRELHPLNELVEQARSGAR